MTEFWSISTRQSIKSEKSDDNYKPGQRVCRVPTVRWECCVYRHLVSYSRGIEGISKQRYEISPSLESTPNSDPKNKIWGAGEERRTKYSSSIDVFLWWSIQRDREKIHPNEEHANCVTRNGINIIQWKDIHSRVQRGTIYEGYGAYPN